MIRNPRDLQRYTAAERSIHWVVGICFILLALSGLAFFHPAFWPLTNLFGGGTWSRILHPFVGALFALSFLVMFFRYVGKNGMTSADWQWLGRVGEMVSGHDENMPEQGKYNGGQKLLFWLLTLATVILTVSGVVMWRAYFHFTVEQVRLASVAHAAVAVFAIGLIIVHVYTAIWTKGSIRAMWYGTVTRAWAKQHHRAWYRQMTGNTH
jgi:formate dehydrogenase subunit gamma